MTTVLPSELKTYKLWLHQKNRAADPNVDIVINPKEFPGVVAKDILEIYHPEEDYSRLLLQFEDLQDEQKCNTQKETVSIDQSIAAAFQLRLYKDVYVRKVNPQEVTLDLLELLFREQYYSRSDMWRMRKSLVNTCAYLTKKVVFADMRALVSELWARGEKVTCGVISEDTRIVFRSPTAVVSIFIQMSSEMWEFDNYGDLYFEKAVDGFLKDLFAKWKDQNCLHDITIVLFSRTFFEAKSLDDFPNAMRDCIQQDYRGRFYEDYYRVVIQNERYEDWTNTLIQLKKLFSEYPSRVLHYHDHGPAGKHRIPPAYNSTAAQGNFLETLNMALNLFEKWYIDRNFDRTGKVAVVITPGAGVYEVDRELCNITKQRTIDCGVGSDLVCVGEQPLHAVPLFKFHNKNPSPSMEDTNDDYNIPHWMNHSFYTSRSQAQCLANSSFVPRIKPPPEVMEALLNGKPKEQPKPKTKVEDKIFSSPPYISENDDNFPFIDYDEYDAQVFKIPSRRLLKGGITNRNTGLNTSRRPPRTLAEAKRQREPRDRHISDNFSDRHHAMSEEKHSPPVSIGKTNSKDSLMSSESEESFLNRPIVGSAGSPVGHTSRTSLLNYRPNRALINPFAPSRMQFKMTSNRRRWVHAFPIDPRGAVVQTHHVHMGTVNSSESDELGTSPPTIQAVQAAQLAVEARMMKSAGLEGETTDQYLAGSMSPTSRSFSGSLRGVPSGDNLLTGSDITGGLSPCNSQVTFDLPAVESTASVSSLGWDPGARPLFSRTSRDNASDLPDRAWLWGPTGEQEWSPDITTGLDWRPLEAHELDLGASQLVKPILSAGLNSQNFCATISVDWKSLVIPASLPITTDYFPDDRSLQNDYVQNDYSLLPDDVNAEYWMRPPSTDLDKFYRQQPLTTKQVFEELISQRLAQGFQLILRPKISPSSSSLNSLLSSSSPQYQGKRRSRQRTDQIEEYYLSIGRIFHRLTLTWPNITVTRYRPRHPQPQLYYKYQYRFQAPDSLNYDVSWTKFSNEKLENYNWNYLDQYICTLGEGDYGLMESLKFWRCKFLLLPCNNVATKKIIEGHKYMHCDIYEERSPQELKQMIEGFLRFLEILNKLKRTAQTRRTKGQQPKTAPSTPVKGSGTSQTGSSKTEINPEDRSKAGAEGGRGSNPDISAKSPSEVRKKVNPPSPLISQISNDVASVTMGYSEGQGSAKFIDSSRRSLSPEPATGISVSSPSQEIVDAMTDPNEGFQFLSSIGLPPQCFVSAEAVDWCLAHIRGVNSPSEGIQLMQKLMNEKYIVHTSMNTRHKFIYGFYVYIILQRDTPEKSKTSGDMEENYYFSNEWCEVAVDPVDPTVSTLTPEKVTPNPQIQAGTQVSPSSLSSSLDDWRSQSGLPEHDQSIGSLYHKFVSVEVDPLGKVNRKEWGTARYHANYSPTCAFELLTQWMVATGATLGEQVYTWARKASLCGFHLLPVPVDPFDLPFTPNSDPLRGPIFVPLKMDCLIKEQMNRIFEDCDEDVRVERLIQFQEAILRRYGFMAGGVRLPHIQSYKLFEETQHHFAHCTGGMFVLIPDNRTTPSQDSSYSSTYSQKTSLLHHDYIIRQTSRTDTNQEQTQQTNQEDSSEHIGFLWSWNFMSTKRWRSSNTGDESYQDKMLADFREFTSNSENRLVNLWKKYRETNYPHLWGAFSSQ